MDFEVEVLTAADPGPEIPSGIPTVEAYLLILESPLFKQLEDSSDAFIEGNRDLLTRFWRREPSDPFHQWSCQWEYPYVFSKIENFLREKEMTGTRLLDAGAGLTFFPYFLANRFKETEVTACDANRSLRSSYEILSRRLETPVSFSLEDIREISSEPESFDVVYCISVLEHTANYGRVLDEFHRVLKPGGLLVVTFDISLDGYSDILPREADRLWSRLRDRFKPAEYGMEVSPSAGITREGILTTRYVRNTGKAALPWSHPYLSALKSLLQGRIPRTLFKDLTCYCGVFRKENSPARGGKRVIGRSGIRLP